MLGDALLSHGETPHYHRRGCVSLLSSGRDQVVPQLYGRQAKLVNNANLSLYQSVFSVSYRYKRQATSNVLRSLTYLRSALHFSVGNPDTLGVIWSSLTGN